ncbi:glutaredoxin isoform X2 [Physcomitrium patens]|uniref:Glutaredoxin domain-containing protein n=1 Tax=Physcomitrium patens TaxID=3218 RepID=A0A2K1KB13_PHYPA|nr:glutaredoxin-like isoform X2 [Physcomitrium patens]PNR50967.1 hypothetical protein PHYPA_010153 [Physcomitrium patens]|eukprot:XP_024381218.1 glutaredoxin-like isoform X2 [Physcomitrella patens]
MAVAKVQELIEQNPLIVFSKSKCPFCKTVKELFKSLEVEPRVVEIDLEKDGGAIQKALFQTSKQLTVPNVFIGGEHIGGNDAVKALHSKGELVVKLKKARVLKADDEENPQPKDEVRKTEAESAQEQALKADGATNIVV